MRASLEETSKVEIFPQEPVEPQTDLLEDRPFTFGVAWPLRLLFVEIAAMMLKLRNCVGEYSLKQCPTVDQGELLGAKARQLQSRLIDLSSSMKHGESAEDLTSKAVLTLLKSFLWPLVLLTLSLVLEMISRCSIPFLIEALIKAPEGSGGWMVGLMIIVLIIGVLLRHNNWRYGQELNLRIRTMLVKVLYKKLMRLSCFHLKNFELSRAITLVTSDLNSIELKMPYIFLAFTAPFTLIYSLVMLILWNGEQGLVGFIYFVGMFALHMIINNRIKPYTRERSKLSEQRIRLLRESLEGLQLLKVYTWERFFSETMACLREQETRAIIKRYLLLILERALSLSSSAVSSILIYITSYYVGGGKLEVSAVFATLQLFMLMRFNVMFFSQSGLDHYFELKEIMGRFLQIMDISEAKMVNELGEEPRVEPPESPYVACLRNVVLSRDSIKPIIRDLTLNIYRGRKYCMTGRVGQGKSTFMYFLLKQLNQYRGYASFTTSISCAEQTSLIVTGTIKHNILMERAFNARRYYDVIHASCLDEDLRMMEKGEQTMLQQDGSTLSGGQRSRINLARALYQEADFYLFDDILSACDENVAACIIERMFSGILRSKATIMLLSSNRFVEYFQQQMTLVDTPERDASLIRIVENDRVRPARPQAIASSPNGKLRPQKQKIPVAPETQGSTYWKYLKESGCLTNWVVIAILFIGCEIIFSLYVWNLALMHDVIDTRVWVQSIVLSVSLVLVYFIKYAYLVYVVCLTNRKLHNRLYHWLLCGKMGYLEQLERSDLVSRFSNDVSVMDMSVPTVLCDALESPLYFLNLIVVISIKVPQWAYSIPFLILTIVLIYRGCNPTLKKSKSLDLKIKSQLINNFTLLWKGATQFKCFGLQQLQFQKLKASIASYYRANNLSNLLQRGFGFFVQSGTLVFSILGVLFTYYYSWDIQSGQELIYCIALSDYIQFGIRQIATLDSLMMSAQRLMSLEDIPSEQIEEGVELPENWPEEGRVEFRNVSMSYANGKEALNNVSFTLQPGNKVGCIGRTGAGKSSLLNALFCLQPISEGKILLDGVDISLLPLGRLRRAFGIIPQTPFLFNGSLRQNVDPYGQFTTAEIAQWFETAHLTNLIDRLDEKDIPLSTGQKQLICLCRCLLHNPKILILDEASASVDSNTDRLIQQTLREVLKGKTVLSIAHRIDSIADANELLSMTDGRVQKVRVYNSYRQAVAADLTAP